MAERAQSSGGGGTGAERDFPFGGRAAEHYSNVERGSHGKCVVRSAECGVARGFVILAKINALALNSKSCWFIVTQFFSPQSAHCNRGSDLLADDFHFRFEFDAAPGPGALF